MAEFKEACAGADDGLPDSVHTVDCYMSNSGTAHVMTYPRYLHRRFLKHYKPNQTRLPKRALEAYGCTRGLQHSVWAKNRAAANNWTAALRFLASRGANFSEDG